MVKVHQIILLTLLLAAGSPAFANGFIETWPRDAAVLNQGLFWVIIVPVLLWMWDRGNSRKLSELGAGLAAGTFVACFVAVQIPQPEKTSVAKLKCLAPVSCSCQGAVDAKTGILIHKEQ